MAKTKCNLCKNSLINLNSTTAGPEADLLNEKTRGYLTHPNNNLYKILKTLEVSFTKFANSPNVFEETCNELFDTKTTNTTFPCTEHQTDMLVDICSFYITMRMRQYSYLQNQKNNKLHKTKKKLSKLVKT